MGRFEQEAPFIVHFLVFTWRPAFHPRAYPPKNSRCVTRFALSLSPSPSCRCEHTLTHARVSTTMWKVRCIFNTRHASMPVEMGPIIRRGREFTTKEATPSGVPCYLVWGKFPVKRREGSLLALVTAFLVIKIRISPPYTIETPRWHSIYFPINSYESNS